jgi:hypothetical protein
MKLSLFSSKCVQTTLDFNQKIDKIDKNEAKISKDMKGSR